VASETKWATIWDPATQGPIPYTTLQQEEEERMRHHIRRAGKAATDGKLTVFADRVAKAQRCLARIEMWRGL
jgi:hypothetical protein